MLELQNNNVKQAHTIEIFSGGCPLCKHITDEIEIGKCKGCSQTIYDVNKMTEQIKVKMKEYSVTSVPTTVIDGKIKVVGMPDFPWICGEDLYLKLKKEYPFRRIEKWK
jgi:tRNA U54 and U55 pseudouridine synthase Pus10